MERWLEDFARANFRRAADTAHDLKTPLNVAVLNLELLRMRLAKLGVEDDEKIAGYSRAVESELRRMGKIFDAFFILSTPPKDEEAPVVLDLASIAVEAAEEGGWTIRPAEAARTVAHEPRIRQAMALFFEGAASLLEPGGREAAVERDDRCFALMATGTTLVSEADLAKLFKFYYSDREGAPELSLAVARLIAETYGGELIAASERDKVTLRLSFPLGD